MLRVERAERSLHLPCVCSVLGPMTSYFLIHLAYQAALTIYEIQTESGKSLEGGVFLWAVLHTEPDRAGRVSTSLLQRLSKPNLLIGWEITHQLRSDQNTVLQKCALSASEWEMLLTGFFARSLLCVQYIGHSIKDDAVEQEGRPPLYLAYKRWIRNTSQEREADFYLLMTTDHTKPRQYFRIKVGRHAGHTEIVVLKTKGKRKIFLPLCVDPNCSEVMERFPWKHVTISSIRHLTRIILTSGGSVFSQNRHYIKSLQRVGRKSNPCC